MLNIGVLSLGLAVFLAAPSAAAFTCWLQFGGDKRIAQIGKEMDRLSQSLQKQTISVDPLATSPEQFNSSPSHYDALLLAYRSRPESAIVDDSCRTETLEQLALEFCDLVKRLVSGEYSAEIHGKIIAVSTYFDRSRSSHRSEKDAKDVADKAAHVFLGIEPKLLYWNVVRQLNAEGVAIDAIRKAKHDLSYLIENFPQDERLVCQIDAVLLKKCVELLKPLWVGGSRIANRDAIDAWQRDFRQFESLGFYIDPNSEWKTIFDAFRKASDRFENLPDSAATSILTKPGECPLCMQ